MIAVNPYRWINRLYSPERRNLYSQELVFEPQQQEHGVSLEPHVYEISASAYKGMALEGRHQSILVSGESGAGKTETVKICLNHLASIQSGPESRGMALSGDTSHVVQRVLDSNPLLEAFGNAKTRRNDNSSRFGKYIQLQFHRPPNEDPSSTTVNIPACHLVGSSSQVYLLEKSRVVHHDPEERTFHIFYQLLAAPDSTKRKFWKHLEGKSNVSFSFVGKTDTNKIEGKTDGVRFQQTVDALQLVGIRAKKLDYLMQAMCAIMQMGNITFRDGPTADSSAIKSQKELETLSDITGVPVKDLEDALTYRNIVVNQERTRVPLRKKVAKDFLDALAKQVYASLFLWLVQSINEATCATKQENSMPDISVENLGIIGLLDIFGFESFQTNGFEQLCINFANEMLQS
jgi:myosin-5